MDKSSRGTQRSKCTIRTTPSMHESEWNSVFRGICLILFLCATVNGQCVRPISLASVMETDPAGTILFNASAPGSITWRYELNRPEHSELKNYLSFTKTGGHYFMTLAKPLDLEELQEQHGIADSGFFIDLVCTEPGVADKNFGIILSSNAVNEYAPTFNTSNIDVYLKETNTVPVDIVKLSDWASDDDRNPLTTEINGYRFIDPQNPKLGIRSTDGSVYTKSSIDFEGLPDGQKYMEVGVLVKDSGGKTGTATLKVHVVDVDDLPPRFIYTGCSSNCDSISYSSTVSGNTTGKLTGVKPATIQAQDGDALGSSITYTIVQGPSGYQDYMSMNPTTADITILKPLIGLKASDLVLTFQAQENTIQQRYTRTTLLISVQGSGAIPLAAASTAKDDVVLIVAVVLGITIFIVLIILIAAMIYYRKRYKKAIHPDSYKDAKEDSTSPTERASKEGKTIQERPRTMTFSEEEMKVDEEITAWLPGNNLSDIVDLSDEDTIKRKRKNGKPPSSTQMNSRDSAFEESSDKKSGSDDSHKDPDPDFDPVTEYAEVGSPSECSRVRHIKASEHVYVPDPTTDQKSKESHNTTDSGVEEAEYLTPNSTRVKLQNPTMAYNKSYRASGTDLDSTYSDLISIDGNGVTEDGGAGEIPGSVVAHVEQMERKRKGSKSKQKSSHQLNKSKMSNSQLSLSDEAEITEYSTPRSDKLFDPNDIRRPVEERAELSQLYGTEASQLAVAQSSQLPITASSQLPVITDDDDRPEVPPRPKIRQISGLKVPELNKNSNEEIQYASVKKKSAGNLKSSSKKEKSLNSHDQNTSIEEASNVIDPPMRRKRHRKRSKQVKAPEEDIYDGTKDYEDLEMDPEFYLDTNKTRIKRSTRIPATQPDPDDTRYWITVASEH